MNEYAFDQVYETALGQYNNTNCIPTQHVSTTWTFKLIDMYTNKKLKQVYLQH